MALERPLHCVVHPFIAPSLLHTVGGLLLLVPSRKRFLGDLASRQQRNTSTATVCVVGVTGGGDVMGVVGVLGACVAGVVGGVDVVRVHSTRNVRDALQVADAVYRGGWRGGARWEWCSGGG